ncbi:ATP-binding protein [Corallococcus interemptor]|uniref:ATP-binding protein n=1 Tax=Corallococcus interemptor TaxID=2316720 RepID=UPI003CFD5137
MADLNLFPEDQVVGVFRGFREGGMEFHADLALPYRTEFHNTPMHGQFLLVQLETPDEAVLGRITSLSSEGRLSGPSGEDFSIRAVRERRAVPEGLREDYLKYRVNIRVLGVLRKNNGSLVFVPSHRRLPHVGSPVAFPSGAVLREIAGHNQIGAELGFFALGEYIFAKGDERLNAENWMQLREPTITVKFDIANLVSRRSFVFARAGFGKSNLNKLLFSALYSKTPTVEKRGGKKVPVGTMIFDPDGEYFWPDDKGRPGLCDVPALEEQVVVFTSRQAPSPFYQSFVAGTIKLDIRRLRPADVISIALPPERQDQQNVSKLRGLDSSRWEQLVNLIWSDRNGADLDEIKGVLGLADGQDAEALAARGNMTKIVSQLHDPASRLLDLLIQALRDGKLCIVDVSQLRGGASMILSGLILRRIFDWNQEQFTRADSASIPTIAVVEEAQSILNEKASAATPYIEWVKEGRKYDLGAVLITQQPGSIPVEILSQGDNWFIFHLLSASDLQNVRKANAHFSDDLLSSLLNEPLVGQGVFWSSVKGNAYPVPLRILSFEKMHKTRDPGYALPAVENYATKLRESSTTPFTSTVTPARPNTPHADISAHVDDEDAPDIAETPPDALRSDIDTAINAVVQDADVRKSILQGNGIPWGVLMGRVKAVLPASLQQDNNRVNRLVAEIVTKIVGGPQDKAWITPYRTVQSGRSVRFIVRR